MDRCPATLTRIQARVAAHIDAIAQGHIEGRKAADKAMLNNRRAYAEIADLLRHRDRGEL